MSELLAPAGNMDALKAAVSNGCDAITKLKKLAIMGEYNEPDDIKYNITNIFFFYSIIY